MRLYSFSDEHLEEKALCSLPDYEEPNAGAIGISWH